MRLLKLFLYNQQQTTRKKKNIPQHACKQVCLESDICVGPCGVVTTPKPHLKSQGHANTVGILGAARTLRGSPDLLGLLTNK